MDTQFFQRKSDISQPIRYWSIRRYLCITFRLKTTLCIRFIPKYRSLCIFHLLLLCLRFFISFLRFVHLTKRKFYILSVVGVVGDESGCNLHASGGSSKGRWRQLSLWEHGDGTTRRRQQQSHCSGVAIKEVDGNDKVGRQPSPGPLDRGWVGGGLMNRDGEGPHVRPSCTEFFLHIYSGWPRRGRGARRGRKRLVLATKPQDNQMDVPQYNRFLISKHLKD